MTVLVTVDGDLQAVVRDVPAGGPFQRSTTGRSTGLAVNSMPLAQFGTGEWASGLTLLGGRPVSYAQLYRTQTYVAAAIDVLTEQVSRLPLKVYEKNSQGERQRVVDHPLVDLIRNPFPRCGPTQLKQWLMGPALLHGNSVLLKARRAVGAPPTGLVPLDWRQLIPSVRDTLYVDHWETSQFGSPAFLEPSDVVHLRWEAPDGPIGVSPLQKLGTTVKIEQAAQDYQAAYLANRAAPPSAIYLPKDVFADDELKGKIIARLKARHGGDNQGNVAVLPSDTKWEAVGHTAHEAELIEQRRLAREEVGAVYKIPQPFLGILDKATYSNVAELHRMFFTTQPLGPWLTLIEESFQAQVIDPEPRFQGLFVEFDLAEVLKGDKLKEINALKLAVQTGLLTLNEARQVLNMPAYTADWCDQPLIPANNLSSEPGAQAANGEVLAQIRQTINASFAAAQNGHH